MGRQFMIVVVSDFDGTMYPYDDEAKNIPKINLEKIAEFRKKGNAFVFCTGRNVLSMLMEIKYHNIEYDYLICNSGAIILDNKGEVLLEKVVDSISLKRVINNLKLDHIVEIISSSLEKMEIMIVDYEKSKLLKYFKEAGDYDLRDLVTRLDDIGDFKVDGVTQFTLAMDTDEDARKLVKKLEKEYGDTLQINFNLNYIDLCQKGTNKVAGIEELISLVPEYRGAKIVTIGDAQNDVEMLKKYCGYTVATATEDAKKVAVKVFSSVGDMLEFEMDN